ncbi:MAG: hypothetical protein ABIH66_00825 [bacterium]
MREGWGQKRDEHHNGVLAEAKKKIGEKQTIDLAKSIRVLDGLVEKMVVELDSVEAQSVEGLAREIRETIKTLNMYLDRPTEPDEIDKEKLSEVLGRIEQKAPEEYAELKEVYGVTSDGSGN